MESGDNNNHHHHHNRGRQITHTLAWSLSPIHHPTHAHNTQIHFCTQITIAMIK